MSGTEAAAVQVVMTGEHATRRWWVAEHSLAGLLARGSYHSAQEAWREAERAQQNQPNQVREGRRQQAGRAAAVS